MLAASAPSIMTYAARLVDSLCSPARKLSLLIASTASNSRAVPVLSVQKTLLLDSSVSLNTADFCNQVEI